MAKQINDKPTSDNAPEVAKQWKVIKQFRDIKDFNLIHKVGDVVEHTQEREDNGLIELK